MKLVFAGLLLAGLAACSVASGGGAAGTPASAGGGLGPQEGSPGNAQNLGSPGSTTLSK